MIRCPPTLASGDAGKSDVVLEHEEGDKDEVEVGTMRGQQDHRPL